MKLMNPEEEQEYAEFMDKIATAVFMESYKSIKELSKQNVDATENVEEIGMSVGQIVLDNIIEATKDMPHEKLLRIFTEVSIAYATYMLQRNPGYKLQIAMLNNLL